MYFKTIPLNIYRLKFEGFLYYFAASGSKHKGGNSRRENENYEN
jgi:hypothetical protein